MLWWSGAAGRFGNGLTVGHLGHFFRSRRQTRGGRRPSLPAAPPSGCRSLPARASRAPPADVPWGRGSLLGKTRIQASAGDGEASSRSSFPTNLCRFHLQRDDDVGGSVREQSVRETLLASDGPEPTRSRARGSPGSCRKRRWGRGAGGAPENRIVRRSRPAAVSQGGYIPVGRGGKGQSCRGVAGRMQNARVQRQYFANDVEDTRPGREGVARMGGGRRSPRPGRRRAPAGYAIAESAVSCIR